MAIHGFLICYLNKFTHLCLKWISFKKYHHCWLPSDRITMQAFLTQPAQLFCYKHKIFTITIVMFLSDKCEACCNLVASYDLIICYTSLPIHGQLSTKNYILKWQIYNGIMKCRWYLVGNWWFQTLLITAPLTKVMVCIMQRALRRA